MGGSKLKNHYVTPRRRQSLRLKGISAIYEAEGVHIVNLHSKHQNQNSGGDCSAVANQIKVEMLETEEDNHTSKSNEFVSDRIDSSYPENHSHEDTITDYGSGILSDLTLKDLRASCKAKKRKVMKSVASTAVDMKNCSHFDPSEKWKDEYVKPKEEEPDLQEPLISLKLSRGSSADRKRRKSARLSPFSLVPMEVVTAKNCLLSSNDMQSSKSAAEMKASIRDRTSKDSASDPGDSKSEAVTVENDFGGSAKENFNKVDKSLMSSATYVSDPELVYAVKTEIVGPCSLDGQNKANGATNSALGIINTCNFLDITSAELLQKSGEGLNSCFPSLVPDLEIERTLHVDNSELIDTVKSENLKNESPLHENTIYIAASSMVDFIGKFNYSENSSTEPLGRIEDVLENQGSNSTRNTPTHCCLSEVSTEYMTPDAFFLPESGEEQDSEIEKVDLSEMSKQKICLSLVSVHNDMNIELAEAYSSVLGHEDSQSSTHDLCVHEMPICSRIEYVTNDPSLLCKEHDVDEIFNTDTEGECLNNSFYHTDTADEQINSAESTNTDIEKLTTEAYKLCWPQPSHTCCGAYSNSPDKSSPKTDELSSKVEGHIEEATSHSVEISGLIEPEELTGAPDFQSPKIISPCSSTLSVFHYADSLSKAEGQCSSFVVEEKLHAAKDQPSSEISKLVDAKGQNMEKEQKNDQGLLVEHPSEKLLSNRKTISPVSQEKLCQALNDIDLCDASQLPSHKEAQTLPVPKLMSKKPKNHNIGPFLSVNKGVLKLPDTSCKTPCSCMKSSSFHKQAEKAIEFSQRQMHDIENIAMKLLKGLKRMRNIMEETLCSESCSSLPSKFTADEVQLMVRAAAENASELESTTRRWLSMMAKDCNRFCKIMRLAESKEATPLNGVSKKQKKKITFADEAGGVLCQATVITPWLTNTIASMTRGRKNNSVDYLSFSTLAKSSLKF